MFKAYVANICSAWFLDLRISTCYGWYLLHSNHLLNNKDGVHTYVMSF